MPIVDDGKLVGIVTRADIVALFDRAEHALLADVRRVLTDDRLLDPDAFEIAVDDGVVRLKGAVRDPRDIRLVEVFLEQVDGVTGIDTSGLAAASTA